MTNHEHYDNMTSGLATPTKFLNIAFYFAVSCALERRVWWGDPQRRLNVNQFVLLVGPPGVGKGLALREAGRLLQAFPLRDANGVDVIDPTTHKTRPLFYKMPDATSFEKLCHEVDASRLTYQKEDKSQETHCSTYFLLEELSSLFRLKKSEDIARLLLNMYDGSEFKYKILRTGGDAIIDNGCMNFIAGTTPDFVNKAEEGGMLGEGLSSRMMIVYADEERFTHFGLVRLTPDQLASQLHLQKWMYCLSRIYGEAHVAPATNEWLQDWWKKEKEHLKSYQDEKLQHYFSRRQVQVIKLAIAKHFSENLTLEVGLDSFKYAADYCRALEHDLVVISNRAGRNQAFPVQERLVKWLEREGGRTMAEIVQRLAPEMDMVAIANTMALLQQGNLIKQVGDLYYKYSSDLPTVLLPRTPQTTLGADIVTQLMAGDQNTTNLNV